MQAIKNMALPGPLANLFKHIDTKKQVFVDLLREAVAIKSVSTWAETRPEVIRMVEWTKKHLEGLGAKAELRDLGTQQFPDGTTAKFPPVLFAQLGSCPCKKTIVVYGHLDVQPAHLSDGWDSEPFQLTERDGKLFGRGASDDKGPVLCWLHAIQSYKDLGIDMPVNIKFVFEGMEESGSEGLDELLMAEKDKFFSNVDYVCISDNYWLGRNKPCITYGLRGVCYFYIEVTCAGKDLHSGIYGGTVHEAMTDLVYLMNTLVDKDGKILVEGLYDDVAPLTDSEKTLYEKIDFDINEYKDDIKTKKLLHNDVKEQILMHRWRYPSLSLHGIEGAFSESGRKTVIPCKVIGKFSVRIVPNQLPKKIDEYVCKYVQKIWDQRGSPNHMRVRMIDGGNAWTEDPNHKHYQAAVRATKHVYNVEPDLTREEGAFAEPGQKTVIPSKVIGKFSIRIVSNQVPNKIEEYVCKYVQKIWNQRGSPNHMRVQMMDGGPAWTEDPNHNHYQAAIKATKHVYNVEPDLTREGGSIPVTLTLQQATGKNVLLLPVGAGDDGAHSQNEKLDMRNYIGGVKLMSAYLYEVSQL